MTALHMGGRFPHFQVIVFKSVVYRCPHVSDFVAFSKVFTRESVFKSFRLQSAFSLDTCGRKPDA